MVQNLKPWERVNNFDGASGYEKMEQHLMKFIKGSKSDKC
jgi:hypothetical protein